MESKQQSKSQLPNDSQIPVELLWKKNDIKAQKNGPHAAVYNVKRKEMREDGSVKGEKWVASSKYIGDWKDNIKEGYGVKIYSNGDKYEGMWANNLRNGQGTYWRLEGKKLKREYTGEWANNLKEGKGTFFYKNKDRYDGKWLAGLPHGEGRMIYSNGDIYEGQWNSGKRNGYGVLIKNNGDHYEGQWVNDKREGQGSYYFKEKAKLLVGEWVNDVSKSGIYTEVEDPDLLAKIPKKKYFTDPYFLPNLPIVELVNPTEVLRDAMENVKKTRGIYRALHLPLEDMFKNEELTQLKEAFDEGSQNTDQIDLLNMKAIFENLGVVATEDELKTNLMLCLNTNEEVVTAEFDEFARIFAIFIEKDLKEENEENEDNDEQIENNKEENLSEH